MDIKLERLGDLTRAQQHHLNSLDFVRWLSAYANTRTAHGASEVFLQRWPRSLNAPSVRKQLESTDNLLLGVKAAIVAGDTKDPTWAAPLVGVSQLAAGFLAIAHSASLLGRVPGLQAIPFNTNVPIENQAASYTWVKQGSPKPASKMGFGTGVTLSVLKSVGIIVLTKEFVKLATPGTEVALRNTLVAGLVSFTDTSLLSPTSTAVADTRPASITAGLTPITPGADFAASVAALQDAFFTARPGASEDTCFIAGPRKAAQLRTLNAGAGPGFPIVVTEAAGSSVILLDPRGIFYADGGVTIDTSEQAAIEMVDNPAAPTASTVVTSLFQSNLVGFKVERMLNFTATPTSVAYLA